MLEFIKKYRKDPKRLVLTLKLNECICLNRLGDLNTARLAKIENENENKYTSESDNKGVTNGAQQGEKNREKTKSRRAFKEQEGCVCLDDELCVGSECDCGCKNEFSMPCASFDAKGGINSEKTLRLLLCDAVVASMLMLGGCMIKEMVLKKKGMR